MGSADRRAREKQELREKILDAARELFATDGFDAVTMRAIAEKIEYSATAIYLHFKDKEELIRELCRHDFLELATRLQKIFAIADPIEKLRKLGLAYIDFAIAHPNHYRVMFMTPDIPGKLEKRELVDLERGNPEQDAYAALKIVVGEAIASGRLRPELRDADLVAQTVWSGMHGVASLEIAKCDDDWFEWTPVKARAKLMNEIIIRGLLKPGEEA
ncbi:MAG TPA: TetR/AcrR family transcriptional regulator [Planctomycetota bacterium]|nr:TetR/AcrR family transcriptional regulator [Planctomycetota bacterium]